MLHIKSVQQSALTTQRTIASIQANDLIDRMWASVCSLDDSTGQIAEGNVSNIKTQWENRWKVTGNTSSFVNGLTTEQIALHNRMNGWSGNLEIVNAAKRRYKITIEWENKKRNGMKLTPQIKKVLSIILQYLNVKFNWGNRMKRKTASQGYYQAGVSLVELMVGLTIGLIITAGAFAALFSNQKLILEKIRWIVHKKIFALLQPLLLA